VVVRETGHPVDNICVEAKPLDVYSESRWSFLQSKGYKWDESWGMAVGGSGCGLVMGVTVPGDPGYGGKVG